MKKLLYIIWSVFFLSACDKQIDNIRPLTQVDEVGQLATVSGITEATVSNYIIIQSFSAVFYDRPRISIGEGRGDNVTLQTFGPVNKQSDAFFFRNSIDLVQGESAEFFKGCYHVIGSTNVVLAGIARMEANGYAELSEADKNALRYAKGENLFLRAITYFNLARVYGKPYYLNDANNPCVPIKVTTDVSETPNVSTVKQVYDYIVTDLKAAAQLMKAPVVRTNAFTSTYASWALLSRVYLYMGGSTVNPNLSYNQLAISYADSTLNNNNGKYTLLEAADYINMFGDDELGQLGRSSFATNKEIIFALDHSIGGSAIGELFHYDPNYATGAVYLPSQSFKNMLQSNDIRKSFLKVNVASGVTETTKWLSQNLSYLTSAPEIVLRIAEVYLNRAEASAKSGMYVQARADLKRIHSRAGLSVLDIDNLSDGELLNAVLKERRIELAFEGQASFDYFRNGLSMSRLAIDNNGTALTITPEDPRVVYPLPNR